MGGQLNPIEADIPRLGKISAAGINLAAYCEPPR
jgi:hypothetical protein